MKSTYRHLLRSIVLLLAAIPAGCERSSDLDLPLAVNSNRLRLPAAGGSTHIMIYSDGGWSAALDRDVPWGSLDKTSGSGNGDVVFAYAGNAEAARRVALVITNSHGSQTVELIQTGAAARLAFSESEVILPRNATPVRIPLATNLDEQLRKVAVEIVDPEAETDAPVDWISGQIELSPEAMTCSVEENTTGKSRQARLLLRFVDGLGAETTAGVLLTQTAEAPVLAFAKERATVGRQAAEVVLPLAGNAVQSASFCTVTATYPEEAAPWIDDMRIDGGQVICRISENATGRDRSADLALDFPLAGEGMRRSSLTLLQLAGDPSLAFEYAETELAVTPQRAEVALPLAGASLAAATAENCTGTADYPAGTTAWIDDIRFENGALVCAMQENATGAERRATVTMNYEVSEGWTIGSTQQLVQAAEAAAPGFAQEVQKASLRAGDVTLAMTGADADVLAQCRFAAVYPEGTEAWITRLASTPGALTCTVTENATGVERQATVSLSRTISPVWIHTASLLLVQPGEEASIALAEDGREIAIEQMSTSATLAVANNGLGAIDGCSVTASYPEGTEAWVNTLQLDADALRCTFAPNTTGADRRATIALNHPVTENYTQRTSVVLVQSGSGDLRGLITAAAGSVVLPEGTVFTGIVISDCGNKNMEANPNTSYNATDRTANDKTAYVQTESGAFGFRLQFRTAGDNTLRRYDRVTLSLGGATLTKEAAPRRYTLSGLTAAHILATNPGTAADLAVKERTIARLNDDDLYTFVRLQDVQIGIDDGSYTNIHENYKNYSDCTPLTLFDRDGDWIRMLTNSETPWRRTGGGVPKGAGTLAGIVVHTELPRYGVGTGRIGTYQIRVLEEEDIALQPSDGRARTLVEWNWNSKSVARNDDATKTHAATGKSNATIKPDIGEGQLYSTIADNEIGTNNGPYLITDAFNGLTTASYTYKGACNFLCSAGSSWWNSAENRGEAIVARFSTAGIATDRMMLIFDAHGGSGNVNDVRFPTCWQLEYSLDGTDWHVFATDICMRPQMAWNNAATLPYYTPGTVDYAFRLPAEVLNRATVYIALRASGTTCEHVSGGTLPDTGKAGNIRLNTLSIRYF